ncbi:MAG: polysaccharide deacetylase [Oscillospiraceae bacterium]|nr:polysaccharide deacetylase [Oscillospiraceae bacterium]
MTTPNEFENRRRERRRRERRRKKRIRAALLLIVLIGIITLACVAVSTINKNHTEAENFANNNIDNTDIVQDDSVSQNADAAQNTDVTSETEISYESEAAVSSIPDASVENNLMQILTDSGQTKHCYLTFDDGPTENVTPQILDILRRYNVKATFFEVGSLIEANPDMARRVYEEGHLIANHSDSHNYDKLYATNDSFITEILTCEDRIRSVMNGEEPFKLIRFPGGSYNSGDYVSEKQIYKTLLAENGFYYCDWNALIGDAEGRTKDASELLEYLKSNMGEYNNLIVLMHDATSKQATADALPSVIEYIASEGYSFHRLDDIEYQTIVNDTAVIETDELADSASEINY